MAYASPFCRLTMVGHFAGTSGAEIWTTNLKIGYGAGSTDPAPFLPLVAPAMATFFSSVALNAGSVHWLTELRGAVIGTDGLYVGGDTQATRIYTLPAAAQGAGTSAQPWPTSAVLSLRASTRGRGPGSHGRMYWPACALIPAANTGRWTTAQTGALATAARTMLIAVNAAASTAFGAGSRVVLASGVGAGVQTDVDKVLVGDRPDHIERRENAVPEVYSTSVL